MLRPPQFRRRMAKEFTAALQLVMNAVDDVIAEVNQSHGNNGKLSPSAMREVKQLVEYRLIPGGITQSRVDRLAETLCQRLDEQELVFLGTGITLRNRELLLESITHRIHNAPIQSMFLEQRDQALEAMKKSNPQTPDWPEYLRTIAALLLILAEIWEWFE